MSVFDELRPFVNLCQAVGFIPFSIETNPVSRKFYRFTFSFKSGSVLWFLSIFSMHIFYIYLSKDMFVSQFKLLLTDNNIPLTLSIFSVFSLTSTGVQYVVSRYVVLQYRHLQNAVETVQNVERIFNRVIFLKAPRNSIKKRLIIGIALHTIFSMVSKYQI